MLHFYIKGQNLTFDLYALSKSLWSQQPKYYIES